MASFSNYKATIIAASEEASGVSGGGGGTTTFYDSIDLLPYIGNTNGDQAYVSSNNRLYLWDSVGWYNIALINNAPNILSVQDSDGNTTPFALSIEGNTTKITILATDSDGDPVTYSATGDSNLVRIGSISQDGNEFTITPFSEDSATAESAIVTFKATDGVNISSSINTFNLNFGWTVDLTQVTYDNVFLSVTSQETTAQGLIFSADGTKLFICGNDNDRISQYNLSTAWDLSTASYTRNQSVSSQDTVPEGLTFNNDGTKIYMVGRQTNNVYQYSLGTSYDLVSFTYDDVSFSISLSTDIRGVRFNTSGTKMFIATNTSTIADVNDVVLQYSLSTAFDISTASYDDVYVDTGSYISVTLGLAFNEIGNKMYVCGSASGIGRVIRFTLATPFDLSTASYDSNSVDLSNEEYSPSDIAFKQDDGTKMYIIGYGSDGINQYSTGL